MSFSKLGELEDSKQIDDRVKAFVSRGESLYEVDSDKLSRLDVDLIVTQDLCGLCAVSSSDVEGAVSRMRTRPEVYSMTPPSTLEHILGLITRIGGIVNADKEAARLVFSLTERINRVRSMADNATTTPNVACVEWLEPLEISPSWVPGMLDYCHARLRPTRSEIMKSSNPWQHLIDSNPDFLIVSPCSFKIEQSQREMDKMLDKIDWHRISAVQNHQAYFVDSDYYNRAGLRLVDGLEITATLVQPDVFRNYYRVPVGAISKIN